MKFDLQFIGKKFILQSSVIEKSANHRYINLKLTQYYIISQWKHIVKILATGYKNEEALQMVLLTVWNAFQIVVS